ncbi:MAG TPA: glycosyltransferase family A protein [Rhizomicrobium sp.]|jgi:glycosyltransferase involved in cell wall biosynthesis|nr:glycosyltransferase family A protein [Rhizomicrobium sp.]
MSNPQISAVICTYNRYDLLPASIASLEQQSISSREFEIIIVDNSPDQEASEAFSKSFRSHDNVRWIGESKPGLSNARNVGARAAAAPLIAFMDDDAIAEPHWLAELQAAFSRFGESAQVAGGRVDPIWGAPRPTWLPDDLLGFVSVVNWGGEARYAGTKEWVAGTNIAFRTEPLLAVGGFSIHLGRNGAGHALLSNDENDVISRLREVDGQLVYAPKAIVSHLVAPERLTQPWFRRRTVWQATSEYLQDPKHNFDLGPRYWNVVTDFYSRLPSRDRTPRGLYLEQSSPDMFRLQLSALHNFTVALLSGFNGFEDL